MGSLAATENEIGTTSPVDVLIIGGGPAGLTAALTVARQLHSAVVFDSGKYRNGESAWMHTVLTWDHKDPKEFREAGRKNILSGYQSVQFQDVEIESVNKTEKGFLEAIDKNSKKWVGKKLILATGVQDLYPDIDGYAECWVKGIFHCLFCHGYEERHSPSSGILAVGDLAATPPALHFARNALQLTPERVTIYTNGAGDLSNDIIATVGAGPESRLKVDSRRIKRLEKGANKADVILHFEDGSSQIEAYLGHKPKTQVNGPFAKQLSLEMTPMGDIKTFPPFFQSSLSGVYTAGDCGSMVKIVTNALYMGASTAAGAAAQLQAETLGQKPMCG